MAPSSVGTTLAQVGGFLAEHYLQVLQSGVGVQVDYACGTGAPQRIWAFPMPSTEDESPVLGSDTFTTFRSWKIPTQKDSNGVAWPPAGYPTPENKIIEVVNGTVWFVDDRNVQDLDSLGALFQIPTRNDMPYKAR